MNATTRLLAATFAGSIAGWGSAVAATFDNASPSADYATGANWSTSVVPTGAEVVTIGNGVTRSALYNTGTGYTTSGVFTLGSGAGGNGTLTLNGGAGALQFGAINIGSGGGAAGSLVVNAGTITASGNDLNVATSGGGGSSLSVGGGTLNVGNRLIIGDANVSGNSVTLSSGAINVTNSVVFGGGGRGAGTAGTFNLNGGTLTAGNALGGNITRYGNAGTYTFNFNGGTLKNSAATATLLSYSGSGSFEGGGTGITYNVLAGGAVFDTSNGDATAAATLVAGAGNGGLTKNGANNLTFTGIASSNPLNMTVSQGILILQRSGMAFNNAGGNANGGTLTANAGATLRVSGDYNIGYQQAIHVNGGTFDLANNVSGDGRNYTLNLNFTGGGTISSSGGGALRWGELADATITVNGATPATINADLKGIAAGSKTGTINVVDPAGLLNFNGAISNLTGGGVPLIKTGAGTLNLAGANTYTAGTTINGGTVNVAAANALGTGAVVVGAGTINVQSAGTGGAQYNWYKNVTSTSLAAGTTLSLANGGATEIHNLTMSGGTLSSGTPDTNYGTWGFNKSDGTVEPIIVNGGTTSTISASRIDAAWGSELRFQVASGSTLNVTGGVGGNSGHGAFGVTLSGTGGSLLLSGTGAYTGATTVSNGQLTAGGGSAIGDLSTVVMANLSTAALQITATEQVGLLSGGGASGGNISVATGATLTTGENGGSASYDGILSGSNVSIRKRGGGTQTLTGNNTFSGGVELVSGTLSVPSITTAGTAQPLGQGSGAIVFSGAAGLAVTGGGASTTTRGLTLFNGANTLTVAGDLTLSGAITGGGSSSSFTKAGTGTFNFSGSAPWSGDLNVSGGTFNLTGGGSFSGVGVTSVSGALNINTTGSMQTSSLDILSGGAVSLDAGTLRVGGGGLGVTGRSIDNAGGSFTWGNGTLAVYTTGSGEAGLTDRANMGGSPSGPEVKEGNYLSVAGSLTASAGSTLDLGSTYLSNGLRYNQLNVDGNLTLNNADLNIGLSPYFLRPNSPSSVVVGDWGTMVLVYAEGTLAGTFNQVGGKTVIPGIGSDNIGWTQLADIVYTGGGSPFDPSTLNLNEWVIEYRDGSGGNGFNFTQSPGGAVLLHYRVAGSVPEPASAGLLVAGTLLLRALRRRRG